MNETQLLGKMKVCLTPYTTRTKNKTDKSGGGVATAVSQQFSKSAVGAGEGENNNEYIVTRLEAFKPALNVVNSYGEQRKSRKEEDEEKWGRLRRLLEEIRMRGEFCLLAGDLNKLVGEGELGVPGR